MSVGADRELGVVEVRRADDGSWRWVFRDGHFEIAGNDGYDTVDEAERSALRAYPGAMVDIPEAVEEKRDSERKIVPEIVRPLALGLILLLLLLIWRAVAQRSREDLAPTPSRRRRPPI